ncbi:hypothetical protein [Kineosporia sp. R_H_3]|uniref:hypothetical protein n=1 Tax=Kineosporia sp. R_H_3 TaxID=1961848 RepID=UPI000B4B844E|nr:hypothetical protein [Kineosporia sp. R_H_3]
MSGQGDLLDLLAAETAASTAAAVGTSPLTVTHMVLPNMALACGRDQLELTRAAAAAHHTGPVVEPAAGEGGETRQRPRLLAYSPAHVTCADCLAVGELTALCAAMQSRQAPTT